MLKRDEPSQTTRMLFLGEESLADGYRLLGFETYADPSADEVDRIIRNLRRNREKAFILVDDQIMGKDIPNLRLIRREGGRIVVIGVPRLASPVTLASDVADRLAALFGAANLQPDPARRDAS